MRQLFKIARISLVLLSAVIMAIPAKTIAASSQDITISPFLREVKFSANDATKELKLNITNNSGKTQELTFSALDFGSLNESGGIVFAGSNASILLRKYGLAHWLELSVKKLTLTPGSTGEIQATIINDVSLQPGGHYAAIVASVEPQNGVDGNSVNVEQKLSSLIFATKVGGEKYDLKLNKVDTGHSRFKLPKSITLRFSNPGNVHVVPRGTVKVLTPGGTVVSSGIINEDSSFVLPETSRQLVVNLRNINSKWLWPTAYKVRVDYRYDGISNYARKEQRLYIVNLAGFISTGVIIAGLAYVAFKFKLHFAAAKFIRRFRAKSK